MKRRATGFIVLFLFAVLSVQVQAKVDTFVDLDEFSQWCVIERRDNCIEQVIRGFGTYIPDAVDDSDDNAADQNDQDNQESNQDNQDQDDDTQQDDTTDQTDDTNTNDDQDTQTDDTANDDTDDTTDDTNDDTDDTQPEPTTTVNLNDQGLVAYIPMEDSSGRLENLASTGTAASLYPDGAPAYGADGVVGNAIRVSEDSAFCTGNLSQCRDAAPYKFQGDFTLGMWVKFDDPAAANNLFRKWEAGEGSYSFNVVNGTFVGSLAHTWPDWLGAYDAGQYAAALKGRSFRYSPMGVAANTWYHVVVVRESAGAVYGVYLDGVPLDSRVGITTQVSNGAQVTSVMQPANQHASTDPFRLGNFNGEVDEFFAYNRILSQSEVQAIYQAGLDASN